MLNNTPLTVFFDAISGLSYAECTSRLIPQFSSIRSAIEHEVDYLLYSDGISFEKIGSVLPGQVSNNPRAHTKYGENHSKLLEALGLVDISYTRVSLNNLGRLYSKMDMAQRWAALPRLAFKIHIIRNILIKALSEEVSITDELSYYLSESTVKRRTPNIIRLIDVIKESSDDSRIIDVLVRIGR